MKLLRLTSFALVLFNVISPLVSASIKIPIRKDNVLEEQLSDLFNVMDEDPIIDEISILDVQSPIIQEEMQVDVPDLTLIKDVFLEVLEDGVCHPKDLSCSGKSSLLEAVDEVQKDEKELPIKISKEREGRDLGSLPILLQEKKEEESSNNEENMKKSKILKEAQKKKPSLMSILKGAPSVKEAMEEDGSGGDLLLKEEDMERVVHLNKISDDIEEEILVPIKERSDDVLNHMEDESLNKKPASKGLFDSVFNMFG